MADIKLNLAIPNPSKFKKALAEAEKQGLTVTGSYEDLGVASGSIASDDMAALRHIDGIESVEPDRRVSVPKSPR